MALKYISLLFFFFAIHLLTFMWVLWFVTFLWKYYKSQNVSIDINIDIAVYKSTPPPKFENDNIAHY